LKTTYTAREVAHIVGLQESRVRYWAQTGFVGPSERAGGFKVYTFQDLISVRAAKELLEHGLTLQRARKVLESLRTQLPDVSHPLSSVRVRFDGERVIVSTDGSRFEPLSGQMMLDFSVGSIAEASSKMVPLATTDSGPFRAPDGKSSAYSWFLEGTRLQADGADDRARAAYERALVEDPHLAEAHTNLGAIAFRGGNDAAARVSFEKALQLDPEQPEARFNLANLFERAGDHERALSEWQRVVSDCPEYADAHFNLAMAYLEQGANALGRTHLERYLELDPDGDWPEEARRILKQFFERN
jgi:tetratricopeptide (TPR) repeat protein